MSHEIRNDIYLEYSGSRQTILLHYLISDYPRLKSFDIGALEQRSTGATTNGAEARNSQTAQSGKSLFAGNYGYLIRYASAYNVYAKMRGTTEVVFFYPKGAQLVADEARYKALGIVRLEASPITQIHGKRVTFEDMRGVIQFTLDKNKETYTVKTVNLDEPAFQVNITAPRQLIQLCVYGKNVIYMFSGGDELLINSLAQGLIADTTQR